MVLSYSVSYPTSVASVSVFSNDIVKRTALSDRPYFSYRNDRGLYVIQNVHALCRDYHLVVSLELLSLYQLVAGILVALVICTEERELVVIEEKMLQVTSAC